MTQKQLTTESILHYFYDKDVASNLPPCLIRFYRNDHSVYYYSLLTFHFDEEADIWPMIEDLCKSLYHDYDFRNGGGWFNCCDTETHPKKEQDKPYFADEHFNKEVS